MNIYIKFGLVFFFGMFFGSCTFGKTTYYRVASHGHTNKTIQDLEGRNTIIDVIPDNSVEGNYIIKYQKNYI